jgi:hypothetical protein
VRSNVYTPPARFASSGAVADRWGLSALLMVTRIESPAGTVAKVGKISMW